MGKKLESAIGILNGAIGDYLARTGNGLATRMECIHRGEPLPIDREALARAHPRATARVVLLAHGVMCTESIWEFPTGEDYGSLLARDLGYTPFYLRYNSGVAIPENGAALARLLEAFVDAYPAALEEILLLGYSMGGLVLRSACHAGTRARHRWLELVRAAIYVGTPHRGAPLERLGRSLTKVLAHVDDPYTRLVAEIADLRSDGVKDLGDADVRHEDRARRIASISLRDPQHPVPMLPQIKHYLAAGAIADEPWLTALFGDAVVPVSSATDGMATAWSSLTLPPGHVRILRGVGHVRLAHDPEVYASILAWCTEARQ